MTPAVDRSHWPQWPETDQWSTQALAATLLSGRLAVSGSTSPWESRGSVASRRLAVRVGRRHCTLTTSGSSAIVVALQALGVGPGDIVLMPATTWVSCATSVLRVGATPAFFDATDDSPCLPIDGGCEPTVLLGVHLYAQHFDLEALRARYPGVQLVEDASHAQLAPTSTGRLAGTLGDISIMSLQATKILTCGEGGAILTDDPAIAARVESLVMDSRRRALVVEETAANELEPAFLLHGANHAASELAAGLLMDQLERMPAQSARRSSGAAAFCDRLIELGARYFADQGALESGNFYGLAVQIPDEWGDASEFVAEVHRITGLLLDRVYPPVVEGPLYRPNTIKQYALLGHIGHQITHSRRWHERHVVVPHQAFLADRQQLTGLADAMFDGRTAAPFGSARATGRPSIDVIVTTQGQRKSLSDALAGVARQQVNADVRVTLWLDSTSRQTSESLALLRDADPAIAEIRHVGNDIAPQEPFARIAAIRQAAADGSTADYVTFLDDDNIWEPDHLSTLLRLISRGYQAVHSWRTLMDPRGEPTTVDRFPWLPAGQAAALRYRELAAREVFRSGLNIVRDSVSVGMVDMGEWMFSRRLLNILKFQRERTPEEVAGRVGEDDILLDQLRRLAVPTACSERATLRYRLGGMSNQEYSQ
ncbi:DegT/DnrJ/EryC1/StrS family aminotransferase [Nonomuraea sp. NPDC049714]|uniref:DegT/DnrJ/EryC1/StrS family aminotransferase n=1 Tax=Nonomuraea sp. NPDC049714 TaxID=3364357 RepID=UPI0037B1E8EF